ncbi:hypothetical protein HPP92_025774 [Vanilla planifolia]|uniref:Uncharacterized protein n=1 Tax=Vanilla planifolia TaxID=51239 RepID=A0A835PEH8_VANPL|nr:hypothetical protein HPP92_025774 [Vanilla planifolia]
MVKPNNDEFPFGTIGRHGTLTPISLSLLPAVVSHADSRHDGTEEALWCRDLMEKMPGAIP